MKILSIGSHTFEQYRTVYILLNSDNGECGNKISGKLIKYMLK